MGIATQINKDFAELIISGRITTELLYTAIRDIINESLLRSHSGLLINVTGSDTLPPFSVMERIADIFGAAGKGKIRRVAILVANEVRYGRARQLAIFLEQYEIAASPFYDRTEAITWLLGTSTVAGISSGQ
jgi:hypothetical protein